MVWKRRFTRVMAGMMLCCGLAAFDVQAQRYPVRPIRLVVGFTPGGVADAIGRLVAHGISEPLGQQVVVENRGGASGAIAYEMVAKSKPDGYTLLIIGATATVLPSLRTLPYDVEKDLAPVSLVATAPFVLSVHPSVPAKSVKELVALARSRPGGLSFGSVGTGSPPHLMGSLFNLLAKTEILHVAYKGGGANAVANASGEIEMSFLSIPSILPLMNAGKLRPLAVTSIKRSTTLSSLPTIHEAGLTGYDYANWNGVVAPTGTPAEIINQLNTVIRQAVASPQMKEALARQGQEPITSTPEELGKHISNEVAKNARLIKAMGLKSQ